jgi:hypothetical protein
MSRAEALEKARKMKEEARGIQGAKSGIYVQTGVT